MLYKVGSKGYEADVLVGIKEDGSSILYDIVNIRKKTITDATSKVGEQAPSRADASVNESIAQPQSESQEKFENLRQSLKHGSTLSPESQQLIRENEQLRGIVADLRQQFRLLQPHTPDAKVTDRIARGIIRQYYSFEVRTDDQLCAVL